MAIRIGIIGSGNMAAQRVQHFAGCSDAKVVAVASKNEGSGRALADQAGADFWGDWREMVENGGIDAVGVFTYNDSHGEMAIAALRADKHLFCEYPCCRTFEEAGKLENLFAETDRVVAIPHREPFSAAHQELKRRVRSSLPLMSSLFVRLTPGRGMRPEVLLNLARSGPPALFFVYHIFPIVDLVGPAEWVESAAVYTGLREDQGYDCFSNALTVGFQGGGLGQWHWSGGVKVQAAEEYQRLVLEGGSFAREGGVWNDLVRGDRIDPPGEAPSEERIVKTFLESIVTGNTFWRSIASQALASTRVGLAAEKAQRERGRVTV